MLIHILTSQHTVVILPAKIAHHSSVLYDDKFTVTGGDDGNSTSDKIYEVGIVPAYTVKALSRMPEQRRDHWAENNACKQLTPLPYEVSEMATVK